MSERGMTPEEQMKKQQEQQKERDRRKLRANGHQTNLQSAHQRDFESAKQQYLEALMQVDMSDAGIDLLDNMLDRSWMLGNLTEEEYHDIKWQLHSLMLRIESHFPPAESCVTGDVRAFILDDADENLEPLTGQQRTLIAQMIKGLSVVVSRSKDGFQQEMNVKSISVSEITEPADEKDATERLGLFS